MDITGKTGVFALFGSPVSHSISPAMYNFSFRKLGLDYVYVAIEIGLPDIKKMVEAARLFRLRGFNLTMPCKNETIHYLDEISEEAKIVGAVNTVVNEDGKLKGYITDGSGFVKNMESKGISVLGKKITVAGSGGAGTAIQVELAKKGAAEINILSRKNGFYERALATAEKIRSFAKNVKVNVYDGNDAQKVTEVVRRSDIFVNAGIVGMAPRQDESILTDLSAFHKDLVVCDIVYNPLETRLLREAKEQGLCTVNGKGMLLYQGVEAFRLFTGMEMPVHEVNHRFFSDL